MEKTEKKDKKKGGSVMSLRRFQSQLPSQMFLHRGLSGPPGRSAEVLGEAVPKPTFPVIPEAPKTLSDNRWVNSNSNFYERHEDHHQTARKLVEGAPRKEKTDALKSSSEGTAEKEVSCPENMLEEETSCSKDMTEREMSCPESMTEKELSCPENMVEKETSCPQNTTEKETSVPENITEKEMPKNMTEKEMSLPENMTEKEEMSCPENMTEKEMSLLKNMTKTSLPENMTEKEEMSCPENMTGKETSWPENMPEKEMSCCEHMTEKETSCHEEEDVPPSCTPYISPGKAKLKQALKDDSIYQDFSCGRKTKEKQNAVEANKPLLSALQEQRKTVVEDPLLCNGPGTDEIKMMEISQRKKSEEEQKVNEDEKSSTGVAQKLKTCGVEESSACDDDADKKTSALKNLHILATDERSTEWSKANSILENQHNVDENKYNPGVDNKLLEELETLPIPEHLKNQIKNSVCSKEADVANKLLKNFFEFWNSMNKIINQVAKSALPNASEQMKEDIIALLEKLFMAKSEDRAGGCLTDKWAEEKKGAAEESKSLKERLCGTDQPVEKQSAIEMAYTLSQQNKLTTTALSQIYSCFQQHQPTNLEENLTCSKDIRSLLNSLNHSMQEEERFVWDSLKEGSNSKGAAPDKEADGSSLKADINSPWHLSELSVDEQCRSPVENSFNFSTYASSSIAVPCALSRTADISHTCGRGTDLKLILTLIQKFVREVGYDSKRQEKMTGSQAVKQKDEDKQMNAALETEADSIDMAKAAAQRKTKMTDSQAAAEEILEKSETEEKEPKASSGTDEEDDAEIMEKSEYEDLEKPQKEQSTVVEPPQATEPLAPSKLEDSPCADFNTYTSPVLSKHSTGISKPTLKTEKKTRMKTKKQREHQIVDKKQQQKKNRRSACKKRRGHQPVSGQKMTKMKEDRQQITTCVEENKRALSLEVHEALPSEQHNHQHRTRKAEKILEGRSRTKKRWEAKDFDENLPPSFTEHPKPFLNPGTRSRGKQGSITHSSTPEEAGKYHMLNKVGKKSRKWDQTKKTCPFKAQKNLQTSVDIPKMWSHHNMPLCDPFKIKILSLLLLEAVKGQLPVEWDWLDVRGGVVRVRSAGDGPHGTSQGHGQGNWANSSDSGGGSSSHGWGGARPKTTRSSGGGGSGGDGDDHERRPPSRNVPDSLPFVTDPSGQKVVPRRNYKHHRKKQHGAITNEQLCHCLGQAGKGMDTLRQSSGVGELNRCMRLCLHDTRSVTSPSPEDLACCTCAILHSLLSHFSTAAHGEACSLCLQLFTLVHFHILDCQAGWAYNEEEREESSRNVCRKMRQARMFTSGAVTVTMAKMWTKVRKYLSAALGPALLLDVGIESEATVQTGVDDHASEELYPPASGLEGETGRKSLSKNAASLPDATPQAPASSAKQIFQDQASAEHPGSHAAVMAKPAANIKLCRRPSHKVIPQKTIPEEPGSPYSSPTPSDSPAQGEEPGKTATANDVTQVTLPSTFPRQAETPEDGDDIMEYIRIFDRRQREQQQVSASRNINDDPYATQKTYGIGGTVSMPETRDRFIRGEQTLSVEMHPVGTPGIGEVVYGTHHQLRLVARNWSQERDRCKASGICQYQHREEGVILHAFKRQLKILHTRYQKHHQWERLVHLGNGVTGKCHLCIDRTSNFKFCCKKLHILHYEDQELDIWSELDHPNIVRFYGAIRHGEKIYMFAEFIDGGSLAALIKEQWLVGRRLSHWTSLNYFRQLLQVLTYLQTKGVLHEDIKADNLLLRDSTTEIVLADFGAAQQIPHDHTPPNRFPTGSPAHWSPEKAASEGHGFSSDLWAAACVLIHMMSGSPPWIIRFPDAAILNYIIWSKPPPLDDLPADVKESMRDLLRCCLVKDKTIRPKAEQILLHSAFKLLDQASSFFSIAQHAAIASGTASCAAPPCVSLSQQAAPPPVQAAPQSVQRAPQSVQAATRSVQRAPQPVQTPPQSVQRAPQPVQTPPQSVQTTPPSLQAAPQSVQAQPQSVPVALQPVQEVSPCQQTVPQAAPSLQAAPQTTWAASQTVQVVPESQEVLPRTQESSHQSGQTLQAQPSDHAGQAEYHHQQPSDYSWQGSNDPQREAGSGMRFQDAKSPPGTDPSLSESGPMAKISQVRPQLSVVRVVEIPRQSTFSSPAHLRCEDQCGPRSLPGSLSAKSSPPSLSQDSSQGHQPVHRKSDPAISTPIGTQEADMGKPEPGPGPQRKMGTVVLDASGSQVKGANREGGADGSVHQVPVQQTHEQTTGLPPEEAQHNYSELKLPGQETRGRGPVAGLIHDMRESLLPLQPAPWPDLPSPVFSLTPQTTGLSPPGLSQSSAPVTLPSGADGHNHQIGPEDQMFFPSPSQTAPVMGRSTLRVPAPAQVGRSERTAARSMELEAEQTQLTSYGTALESQEHGMISQPAGLPIRDTAEGHSTESREYRSGITLHHCEVQPAPLTRVGLTRTTGTALQFYTVPQLEQRQNAGMQAPPDNLPATERNTVLPTTTIGRSLPSDQATVSAAQRTTQPGLQAASENQQGMGGGAERRHDIPNKYPVLPALSPEDFQVPGSRHGIAHLATLLSMIPEGVEQESISPPTQVESSGESGEGTMWDFIQDQFAQPSDTDDQLLQSLRQRSDNRPRLELYAPLTLASEERVGEEARRQQPVMLPRFELLQSSLSDSSTLRSTRITTSEEESSVSSQPVAPVQGSTKSGSSPASQHPRDEPDYAFTSGRSDNADQKSSGSMQASGQVKNENVRFPPASGHSDEEHISSGDIFGSGPHRNPAFQEAYQYREQQHQQPAAQPSQPGTSMSKSMSRKQPNLRLNVTKPAPFVPKTQGSQAHNRDGQTWGLSESGSSAGHHGDDAFLLHAGVSPLTASPLYSSTPSSTPRHTEVRPRSRNESGSSASTPKSSTYDRQEQEWTTLQQQTPGLEDALLEDPMIASGSELSSTHHLSLLYGSQVDSNTSDQEENDVLSMLQEGISNDLGGQQLVFENAEGQFLFKMRVLDKNKGWKELATTFRGEIQRVGFRHFQVVHLDGSPVEYFSAYNATITRVKVIEVSDERDDIFSVCWCDHHLVY